MAELVRLLNDMPIAAFMLVVAIGYTVGRVSWRGVALGPAGGTLGIAILFGVGGLDFRALYGSDTPRFTIGALGFAFFLYSVGFEAGPRFFSALLGGRGLKYVLVGTLVNVFAFALALGLGALLGLGPAMTTGMLAGALTSPSTYAAALEVVSDQPDLAGPLAVSFALVYPVGLVGIVFLIQVLPRWRGRDLAASADREAETGRLQTSTGGTNPEIFRAFEVSHAEVAGRPLQTLDLTHRTGCTIAQIHRADQVVTPNADSMLEVGDRVLVQGRFEELQRFEELVGPEVYDVDLKNRMPSPRRVALLSSRQIGRTIAELDLPHRCGCLVLGVERGDVHLEIAPDTHLERGDILEVVGRRGDVRAAAELLGRLERPTHETDIGVYAAGIFLGLLIGQLSLHVFGVDLSLGFAGGLLLSGILMGRARRIGPFHTHVPRAARQLVQNLGILLFVAEAGVRAGGSSLAGLEGHMAGMLAAGVVVSLVPVVAALVVACRFLHVSPVDAWGSVSGGMTSSAALTALQRVTDSNTPAVSYAAAYAVASVLLTIAGRVLMLVLL